MQAKKNQTKKNPSKKKKTGSRTVWIAAAAVVVIAAIVILVIVLSANGKSPEKASSPDETAPLGRTIDDSWYVGESVTADQFEGEWVSYRDGIRVEYAYADGEATFAASNGTESHYHYEVKDDRIVLTSGEKRQVYLWKKEAVNFIADRQYGDVASLIYEVAEEIEDFKGYMYVDGDFLYIGRMCMCREETLDTGDQSLTGSWIGAAGDLLTFNDDGTYHYREESTDYFGKYALDETGELLTLTLNGESLVYSRDDWKVSGRIFRMKKQYYFRKDLTADQK